MPASRDLRHTLGIFGAILVAAMVVGVLAEPGGARSGLIGAPAPDLVALDTDGSRISVAELRGRPVWLSFFSSWCVRCRSEDPDIEAIHLERRRGGGDLVILGIGVGETATTAAEYARNARLTYTIAADPDRAASRAYAVFALPTHVLIGRDGIVRDIRVGALPPELMRELVGSIE